MILLDTYGQSFDVVYDLISTVILLLLLISNTTTTSIMIIMYSLITSSEKAKGQQNTLGID